MITNEIVRDIEKFVYSKPRSIQEIAEKINKNWRTADRYVEDIEKNYGTIATRTFRGGTRGALKIVYWASVEKASSSAFQEMLENEIMLRKGKEEFSSFDIFQYVNSRKKEVWIQSGKDEVFIGRLDNLANMLLKAKKHLLLFSGNLSFTQYHNGKTDIFKVIEGMVKRGISIKAVCRVDLSGIDNIEKLLSLNKKYGKELVEIRHRDQPLRTTIVDGQFFNMKEIFLPTGKKGELKEKTFAFYTIHDKEWIEWITKIFWKMFSGSIDANRRMEEIRSMERFRRKK